LDEFRLPAPVLEHVSAGQLIAHIDRAWDLRDELRTQIHDSLPKLQTRARANIDVAVEMLCGSADYGTAVEHQAHVS
jgi:hypothetical protein